MRIFPLVPLQERKLSRPTDSVRGLVIKCVVRFFPQSAPHVQRPFYYRDVQLAIVISYSGHDDRVAALRLQTLASTSPELQVHVSPVSTRSRRGVPTGSDPRALEEARFVLANISDAVPPAIQQEPAVAQRLGETIVPTVVRGTWFRGQHSTKSAPFLTRSRQAVRDRERD